MELNVIDKNDKMIIEFLSAIDKIQLKLSRVEAIDEVECVIMTKEAYKNLLRSAQQPNYSDVTHGI